MGNKFDSSNNAEQYAKDWGDNYVRAALLVEKQPRRFLRP